jgi:hypothetical protein
MTRLMPLTLVVAIAGCIAETAPEEIGEATEALLCGGFNRDYQFAGLTFQWDGYPSNVSTALSGGGYATVSTVLSGGQRDFLVTRVDASGALVWANRYGGAGTAEEGLSIVQSHDAMHVLVTGRYQEFALVTKIRFDGTVAWTRIYGDPTAGRIETGNNILRQAADAAGATDYIVYGNVVDMGTRNLYLLRIQDDGDVVWQRMIDASMAATSRAVGMQPNPAVANSLWLAAQHSDGGFESFGLLEVNPVTGINAFGMTVYEHGLATEDAILGEFAKLPDGFIATYQRLIPGGNARVGVLRIAGDMSPTWEKTYFDAGDLFGAGFAVFPLTGTSGGFDVGTSVRTATGVTAGVLRLDAAGNPLSHREYQDYVPSGVGPMARASGGYLLRTQNADTLRLTIAPFTGTGCCERSLPLDDEEHDVLYRDHDYYNVPWGVSTFITLTPVAHVPVITSCVTST